MVGKSRFFAQENVVGGILALGVEGLRQIGPLWAGLIIAVVTVSSVFLIVAGNEDMKRAIQIRALAQEAWMADCQKPIDECLEAWDRGYSLRKFYVDKAERIIRR